MDGDCIWDFFNSLFTEIILPDTGTTTMVLVGVWSTIERVLAGRMDTLWPVLVKRLLLRYWWPALFTIVAGALITRQPELIVDIPKGWGKVG